MEERLLQNLKNRYRFVLIGEMILLVVVVLGIIAALLSYLNVISWMDIMGGVDIKVQCICAALLLGMSIAGTVTLVPYKKDLDLIRRHECRVIEATFVRFDYRRSNDEDRHLDAVPLFQDTLTREIVTFSIDEKEYEMLERDACYRIGYLPNTKIAVVDKRFTDTCE